MCGRRKRYAGRPVKKERVSPRRAPGAPRAGLGLYIHTLCYLKPGQAASRIRRRVFPAKRKLYVCRQTDEAVRACIRELDGDPAYTGRFNPREILEGRLRLLHQTFPFPQKTWKAEGATRLWNFNLHYFEYGIALALAYQREGKNAYKDAAAGLIDRWIDCVEDGDGWHPYTVSVRLPNWKVIYEILGERPPEKVLNSMYSQYRYLIKAQETHLLGNHYFENLKTLVIFSLYFKEMDPFRIFWKKLKTEIREQILSDGIHFERSMMYHKIIMEDILRVREALMSGGMPGEAASLDETLGRMGGALYSLESGMGRTPLFNDAGDNVAKSGRALLAALKRAGIDYMKVDYAKAGGFFDFPEAGYYKRFAGGLCVILDCGKMGPGYLTGHGHCDALSFELSAYGIPVLVNSGTYQYQDRLRPFFRSARAHNTVEIAGREQSEIWGEHRTGRRLGSTACARVDGGWIGSYETYEGYRHRRLLRMRETEEGTELVVEDAVHGPEGETASAFFHLAPGFSWEMRDGGWKIADRRGDAIGEEAGAAETAGKKEIGKTAGLAERKAGAPEMESARAEAAEIEAQVTVKTENGGRSADVIIHQSGDICAYAPEFGKRMKKQVMEIRFKLDGGAGGGLGKCSVRFLFKSGQPGVPGSRSSGLTAGGTAG